MSRMVNMIVLARGDNVGVATRDIAVGEEACDAKGWTLIARAPIPQGHKIALETIETGADIRRLAVPVGIATRAIGEGDLVHVHNVKSRYLENDEDHYE
jgi:SAF domain